MQTYFPSYPDSARLWVFALGHELSQVEHGLVSAKLEEFMLEWKSHGTPVNGAYQIVDGRFVLITGYVDDGVSGCSTDTMMRVMTSLRKEHGIDGFNRTLVFFRDAGGAVRAVTRGDFQKMVDAGEAGDDTIVFDPTVTTVGELRSGRFETTFARAWHANAFGR
jgi:hypothetical protein